MSSLGCTLAIWTTNAIFWCLMKVIVWRIRKLSLCKLHSNFHAREESYWLGPHFKIQLRSSSQSLTWSIHWYFLLINIWKQGTLSRFWLVSARIIQMLTSDLQRKEARNYQGLSLNSFWEEAQLFSKEYCQKRPFSMCFWDCQGCRQGYSRRL